MLKLIFFSGILIALRVPACRCCVLPVRGNQDRANNEKGADPNVTKILKGGRIIMKKLVVASLCLAVVLAASVVMAGALPGSGIRTTFHDLSSTAHGPDVSVGNTTEGRVCIFCHAPHFTLKADDAKLLGINYYPLWNHTVTQATFKMYDHGTDQPGIIDQQLNAVLPAGPQSSSKLCLSCHDGTVAVGAYGYAPSSSIGNGTATVQGRFAIGTDLRNHHPISFDYTAVQLLDSGIFPADTLLAGGDLGLNPNQFKVQDILRGGKYLECGSCHSVHNTLNQGAKFLWIDDTKGSALCFSCHNK
jgi:predicted CXXCH cytochrome family protein